MGLRSFNILSLCSGYGGLDLGVGLAVPTAVTVCYVEREAYANAVLVSRIQDEALDDAPIWSDLRTFDGKPWRGVVDCVIGGYPCQPFSIAGKQRGVDDPRHLWPDIARIIREVRPAYCFFENVRQHINIGLDVVWSDLRTMGYRVEGGIFSAAEVGAPHRRERLFLLAHTSGDTGNARAERSGRQAGANTGGRGQGATMAHADRERGPQPQGVVGHQWGWPFNGEQAVADTDETRLEGRHGPLGGSADERVARTSSATLAHATGARCGQRQVSGAGGGHAGNGSGGSVEPERDGPILAHATGTRREVSRPTGIGQLRAEDRTGLDNRSRFDGTELGIFPPGPTDFNDWAAILEEWPNLAPATQSPIRGVADGATANVAGHAEQLRLGGNGVVPLQSAYAFSVLATRAGLSSLLDAPIVSM